MGIPKKYKKQVRGALKSARDSGEHTPRAKRTWTVCEIGDLVETDGGISTVIESREDGWFQLMGPSGKNWVKGSKIRRIQKVKKPPSACKVD